MKRVFVYIFLLIFAYIELRAIPAFPRKSVIVVNGEVVYITIKGDENCKFAIDEQGYTVLPTENGWNYAAEDEQGNVVASAYKLMPFDKLSVEAKEFLKRTRKGILPMADNVGNGIIHKSPSMANANKMPVVGPRKALMILMQFRDTKFTKSKNDFQRLFNEQGYTEDGAMGSVYDFYHWSSYGQLELQSDVLGPYTAQNNMSYYGGNSGIGGNDKNPYALFTEAINHVIQEIDLSDYDANGDGYVDNVHIIYAGYGEEAGASSNAIWAHQMSFPTITVQGMKLDRYSCAPELRENRGTGISRIGVHCHEIGHALGAMDYYDTDYEKGGNYLGTGQWDVMAQGSWNNNGISPAGFNPYVKVYDFGWTEAKTLVPDTVNMIMPSTESGNIYRIDTGVKNDFFLLENRNGTGYYATEPGQGLLIFHIGPQQEEKAASNSINTTYPQQCYPVCASSTYKKTSSSASSYGKINSAGCPFPGTSNKHEFSDKITPAALTINGEATGISLTDIAWDGDNIKLFCGKSITGDDTGETETSSWQEDFERMKIPATWEYSDIEGLGEFTVKSMLSSNDSPQLPVAASGKGYARYSALSQNGFGRHHTRGVLKTAGISLTPGKQYRLLMKARKYARLQDASDSLIVSLYDKGGNVVHKVISEKISNQDVWAQFSANIPENMTDFSIGVECNIDYGSVMFIDDMKIVEYDSGMDISSMVSCVSEIYPVSNGLYVKANENVVFRVYALNGICLYNRKMEKDSSETFTLRVGVYVVSIGDRQYKIRIN